VIKGDDPGLFALLLGDGRPAIALTGLLLMLSGAFGLFLAATTQFLPHDLEFLGLRPDDLCAIRDCRIVRFLVHDRMAFGGTLVAVGTLYVWLAAVPLSRGQAWAWWTAALSGGIGFASFLSYLGTGYLDSWHGIATAGLLPIFLSGLVRTWPTLNRPRGLASLRTPAVPFSLRERGWLGRALLMLTAVGMVTAGLTIATIGALVVLPTHVIDS